MTMEQVERNCRIVQRRREGWTLRAIADAEGIHHERVRQIIIARPKRQYRLNRSRLSRALNIYDLYEMDQLREWLLKWPDVL